jgi:uncharacterized Zn finger protein (UPF0148 family)
VGDRASPEPPYLLLPATIVRHPEGTQAMTWFKREDNEIVNDSEKTVRTEGLWTRCPDCGKTLFKAELEANQQVCPQCGHHFRIDARARVENLLEPGYELVDLELRSTDPLNFTDLKPYKRRLAEAQQKTGLNDAQRRAQRDGVQLHRGQHGGSRRRNHCPRGGPLTGHP